MARDTFGKITIYKLDSNVSQSLDSFDGFTLIKEEVYTVEAVQMRYRLFFLEQTHSSPASWYKGFRPLLATTPHSVPVISLPGFILIVYLNASVYAVTGGLGYAPIRKSAIEGRFGLTLARKLISETELRGLSQKDTGGNVNYLDRAFRRGYSPASDSGNLKRILTHLRARLSDQNPRYRQIGKSITAGDALTVNGQKAFDGLMRFIVVVEELWTADMPLISIPQLEQIHKKRDAKLIEMLNDCILEALLGYDSAKDDLFIDNDEIGYLPDRVVSYQLLQSAGAPMAHPTVEDLFSEIRQILTGLPDSPSRKALFKDAILRLTFDDGHFEDVSLPKYICGDITFQNEVYFANLGAWFHATQDYLAQIARELDEIPYVTPESLGLSDWDTARHSVESDFNKAQTSYTCLDTYLVRLPQERGGIEFCDLLRGQSGEFVLMHVKRASGAELRALFAQGDVSSKYFAQSSVFREKVMAGDMDRMPSPKPAAVVQALASLRDVPRHRIRVVFAIFDDTRSHVPPPNSTKTSEMLQGTLSAFAKVDLLTRVEALRGPAVSKIPFGA